ncbi:MAG: hypothetical protein IKD26_02150 [Clostridia bacterium]|nr:hypothetical protein [Clostridia bacterium]
MKQFKTDAYIYSLNKGQAQSTHMDEITVLEQIGDNTYKVDYKGTICTAIFNWFNCTYYADDIYGVIKE